MRSIGIISAVAMLHRKVKTVNPEFSQKTSFNFVFIQNDVHRSYGDNHFMMYVNQIIILYTLNLHSTVCLIS